MGTLCNLRWDYHWTRYIDGADSERTLCMECYNMLGRNGRQKEEHRRIFDQLPELMGVKVEGWGERPLAVPENYVEDGGP